jgi:ABC-type lipoprotein release transport system permease subunit
MILRLALRNTLRNVRRTALTAVAVALSFALLIVFLGLSDGAHENMAEIGVSMGLGDVVVQATGYAEDPSLARLVHDPVRLRERLLRKAGVREVATRLRSDALLTAGATSVGVALSGVDPKAEARVSKIDRQSSMRAGQALAPRSGPRSQSELPPIVIGQKLAQTLVVDVGDRVTLTLRPAGKGDTRSAAFAVRGIFATGVDDVDAFWAEIPLEDAQRLTGVGDRATSLALLLDNIGSTSAVAQSLRAELSGEPVEVLSWMQAAPDLYTAIVVDEGGMYVMMLIVFVVVATGILNTLLMSVVERLREFGVLLALGATPLRIAALVLCEALVLGLCAMSVGLALGLAVNHRLTTLGVDIAGSGSGFETSGILLPSRLYSHLYPHKVVVSSGIILGLVLLGAAYPALRAATEKPVEAMRHD